MEIKDMSSSELKEMLSEIRMRRKNGYVPRKKAKPKIASEFDGIPPEIAEKILSALLEGDTDDTDTDEAETESGDDE